MNELTVLLFVCAIGLWVLMFILKKDSSIAWMTMFVSVCSMGQTLTDNTLEDMQVVLLVIPAFYVMLTSGLAMMNNGGR